MKIRILAFIIFMVLGIVFIFNASYAQETIESGACINVTIDKPEENASFEEHGEFEIETTAICNGSSCGIVEIYPQCCSGLDCESFEDIETSPYAALYSKDEIPQKCLNIKKGERCSKLWRIKTKKVGMYRLRIEVVSTNAPIAHSDIIPIKVRGCGDGNCSENETHTSCPEDCCDSDCTAIYDNICHRACDGYNGCSLTIGCDGKFRDYRSCISANSIINCCDKNIKICEYKEYCSDAICKKCSDICDNYCESKACYSRDPDCDRKGNATMPCCGNNIMESGEECDGNATGTPCDGKCRYDCKCGIIITTSTSTSTTSSSSTSTSTTSSSSSTSTTTATTTTTTTSTSTTSTTIASNVTGTIIPTMKIDPSLIIPVVLFPIIILIAFLYFYIKHQKKKQEDEFEGDGVTRWIEERLDAGEDPELLKKGVIEAGLDPKIVDEIRKKK